MPNKFRLLVVDTESALIEILQVYLKNSSLTHAYSIEEARFLLVSYDFDLILINSIHEKHSLQIVETLKKYIADFIPILSLTKSEDSKGYKIVAEVTLKVETTEHISDSILKLLCLIGN